MLNISILWGGVKIMREIFAHIKKSCNFSVFEKE